MRKFIALMLAAGMALSLTACQKSDEASGSAAEDGSSASSSTSEAQTPDNGGNGTGLLSNPIALTEDGGAAPYEHGGTENAVATLSFAGAAAETLSELSEPIPDYELLSDEDIEALF